MNLIISICCPRFWVKICIVKWFFFVNDTSPIDQKKTLKNIVNLMYLRSKNEKKSTDFSALAMKYTSKSNQTICWIFSISIVFKAFELKP